jgi:hypothetical protein
LFPGHPAGVFVKSVYILAATEIDTPPDARLFISLLDLTGAYYMSSGSDKGCSRCNRVRGEVFRCFNKSYVFDVRKACELVADGREKVQLEPDDVRYSVDRNKINERHIAHVDPSIPGIVSHLYFQESDGTLLHGHRLIDGNHRASRCLQLGIPFYVYILTEEESVAILKRAPEGARPDKRCRAATAKEVVAAQESPCDV